MSTIAKIILVSVNDDSAAQDAQLAGQRDLLVADVNLRGSRVVSNNIAQVSGVPDLVRWPSVLLAEWVEVWSSRHASVGIVAELVDVEAVKTGFQSGNRAADFNRIGFRLQLNANVGELLCKSSKGKWRS